MPHHGFRDLRFFQAVKFLPVVCQRRFAGWGAEVGQTPGTGTETAVGVAGQTKKFLETLRAYVFWVGKYHLPKGFIIGRIPGRGKRI